MRIRIAHGLALLLLMAASLGAAQGPTRSESAQAGKARANPAGIGTKPNPARPKPYQVGTASWYGTYFDGKPTASGEPFNMYDLTAAHPSLPLGSFVRVTNLRNGKAVVVRVNDRGPIVEGRIIDLSYSAAQALKFKDQGLQRVRLDLVPAPTVELARAVVAE